MGLMTLHFLGKTIQVVSVSFLFLSKVGVVGESNFLCNTLKGALFFIWDPFRCEASSHVYCINNTLFSSTTLQ
jgi:hypothetical protein